MMSSAINGQNPTLWELKTIVGLSRARAFGLDQRHDEKGASEDKTQERKASCEASALYFCLTGSCHLSLSAPLCIVD